MQEERLILSDAPAGAGIMREFIPGARVLRRGGRLCFCDVEVTDGDDRLVAKALVTYKLG